MRALSEALELTFEGPAWWAVSAAGFLARGGVLLFVGLLVQLPSPITVTLIFGLDSVTGTGDPSARLLETVAALAAVGLVGLVAMGFVAAWTDVAAFARVHAGEGPPADASSSARGGSAREVLGVSWLQALGLFPGLVGFVIAAPTVREVAVGELLLPSAPEVPFILRVLEGAQGPLLRAAVIIAVLEVLVTIATRLYLSRGAHGSSARAYVEAIGWIVRRPLAATATWLVGWGVLLGALVLGLWAVALAWEQARVALLDPALGLPLVPGTCTGAQDATACAPTMAAVDALARAFGASLLFVAVWVAALALVGAASAFRSSLWTLTVGVRHAADPARALVRNTPDSARRLAGG
jgi:hypothetical protein